MIFVFLHCCDLYSNLCVCARAVCLCVCVSFCVGNILVIVIVAATKTFHSVTSVLIMNLAISDLLVGVGVMPFVALSVMNRGWVDFTVRHLSPRDI